jgi:hypothetical protein
MNILSFFNLLNDTPVERKNKASLFKDLRFPYAERKKSLKTRKGFGLAVFFLEHTFV